MKSEYRRLAHQIEPEAVARIIDAAHDAVDAYLSRFESRGQPNGIFGPIDEEMMKLKALLDVPMMAACVRKTKTVNK